MLDDVIRRRLRLPESGIEIALLDWGGDGPLALLHHANGFCAAVWGVVAEALRPHYRVVAMDARGHGGSSKPEGAGFYRWEVFGRDAADVARQLAAEHPEGRVALGLGHSFGGTALLAAAADPPDLFGRLVLVDPVIPPPAERARSSERLERAGALADGARNRRHVWPSRDAARERWRGKDLFADWDPRCLELYLAFGLADRADGQVELACPGAVEGAIFESGPESLDVWTAAERVRVPTRVQWARRGQFPREAFEALVARMADGRVEDADAGHLVVMERPDEVVRAVLELAPA